MIKIAVGPKFDLLIEGLRKAPRETIAALGEGLGVASKETADAVAQAIYSGASGIQSRSGTLANSLTHYPETFTNLTWYIGVGDNKDVENYAYLLTDEQKIIKPKNGQFLSIPSGDNKYGVYFQSPRDVPGGYFIHKNGGVYFGDTQDKQFRLLFTMVREVLVQGFGVLTDVALDRSMYVTHNKMAQSVRRVVRHRLSELGIGVN